jgi:hypothetical protein
MIAATDFLQGPEDLSGMAAPGGRADLARAGLDFCLWQQSRPVLLAASIAARDWQMANQTQR